MTVYTAAHWGIYEVDPGTPPALSPWREDPDPNQIGVHALAPGLQAVRVRRPAVRRSWLERGPGSAPELRGREPFVEVDWAVALDLVAADLARVKAAHGNKAIFGGSYGWSSAGRFHHAQSQVHRFLNMIGGYVRHNDSYSLGAGRVIMPHVLMSLEECWDQTTSFDVMAEHTRLFVAFGGVPAKNAQISAGGAMLHRVRDGLAAMVKGGTRFINISPVADNLDTGGLVEWIPIRPNTDTALMLALAHVVLVENLLDRDFLGRCCHGFDRFEPYLSDKTPQWASEITGIPAERIARLAREMAGSRTMMNIAWSLQRASHGEQPFWMVVALASMLGQIGLPGGGFAAGYGPTNRIGSPHIRLPGPSLPQGNNRVREFIPVARIADMLLNPGAPFQYNGGHHTYPDIKLVYWAGGNPFHHHQDTNKLRRAWAKPDTIVVHEPWWTATARHADIVLPATTSLERNDIGGARRDKVIMAMGQAVAPVGQARNDFDIFSGLAQRLGVAEVYTQGRDENAWLRHLYENCRHSAGANAAALPDFDTFWKTGYLEIPAASEEYVIFGDFRADPDQHKLRTPSGKIELYSEKIAGFGYDDCPPHPTWIEPWEWLGGKDAKTYPLHLVSSQPRDRLHSQMDCGPVSAGGKIAGREAITINPADAKARGIGAGDVVRVHNARGSCLAGVIISDTVSAGVVNLSCGAWYDPADGGEQALCLHGNSNVLTRDQGTSKLGQGPSSATALVEVERYTETLRPVSAFDPPRMAAV